MAGPTAIVCGTAVNQDGRSSSLTAPNGPSQQALISAALSDGGVQAAHVNHVAVHGTGTPLGDPIEVGALAGALGGKLAGTCLTFGSNKVRPEIASHGVTADCSACQVLASMCSGALAYCAKSAAVRRLSIKFEPYLASPSVCLCHAELLWAHRGHSRHQWSSACAAHPYTGCLPTCGQSQKHQSLCGGCPL